MSKYTLTVLTDPIPYGKWRIPEYFKKYARIVKRLIQPLPSYMQSPYRGHPAVTRSLVEGLKKINYPANYNPIAITELAETVIVLSGIETLKQAIHFKRIGKIKRLLAGPNILEFPADHKELITSPEIDACITPSEVTNKMYEENCLNLKHRLLAWPAGVDVTYWMPNKSIKRDTILIYEKQRKGPVGPVEPFKHWLEDKGYRVKILKCGEYTSDEFRALLNQSILMIGFVIDESQGIAWAEAWSMDVPTLIWENKFNNLEKYSYDCSTAPYLCEKTGLFFKNIEDFKLVFETWVINQKQYAPRKWVISNMSDEVCAKKLCTIAEQLKS